MCLHFKMIDPLEIVSFIQIPLNEYRFTALSKKVSFVNKITQTNKLTVVYKRQPKLFP